MGNSAILVGVVGAVAIVALGFVGAVYVLKPMDRAARDKVAPVQFTILDFLSLTAFLAIPLAPVTYIDRTAPSGSSGALIIAGAGSLVATAIWAISVRTAAKAGIVRPKKRLLMIGAVVPVTYAMTLGASIPLAAAVSTIAQAPWSMRLLTIAVVLAWLAYYPVARRIVVWILTGDAPRIEASSPWTDPVKT